MKTLGRIIEAVVVIILFIVLLINLCFAYSKYVKKDEIANVFGYTYMIVESNSMEPTFAYKNKLIIKLGAPYKVGDIITFKEDGVFITHRVVEINVKDIVTKGDGNNTNDSPIKKDQVVGVVKRIIK